MPYSSAALDPYPLSSIFLLGFIMIGAPMALVFFPAVDPLAYKIAKD